MNIGLQLYTIRDQLAEDAEASLRKIAGIGYRWVELFPGAYAGKPAAEFKSLLSSLGLRIAGGHAPAARLKENLSEVIDYHAALGCPHLVCAKAEFSSEQDVHETAVCFNAVGRKAREAGMFFSYHNHSHEFAQYRGRYILDMLLEETDPALVGLELDVYWAAKAGLDPAEYQKKWRDRSVLLHCKDMDNTPEKNFTAVGLGVLNFPAIIKAASNVKWMLVELDMSDDPFLGAEQSLKALEKLTAWGNPK
jgi:sugar phosphate isomerase/epimerase